MLQLDSNQTQALVYVWTLRTRPGGRDNPRHSAGVGDNSRSYYLTPDDLLSFVDRPLAYFSLVQIVHLLPSIIIIISPSRRQFSNAFFRSTRDVIVLSASQLGRRWLWRVHMTTETEEVSRTWNNVRFTIIKHCKSHTTLKIYDFCLLSRLY